TYGGLLSFTSYAIEESVAGGTPSAATTLSSASTLNASVTGLTTGASYSFFLATTDCFSACGTGTANSSTTDSNSVTYGTPLPLSASVSAERPAVDLGQPDLFTCTPSGGRSPFNYTWTVGNNSTALVGSSASLAFASPGTASVTCQVEDSLLTRASAAVSVDVATLPTAQTSANRTATDLGGSVALMCAPGGGLAPYTVSWLFGDGSSANGGSVDHIYSSAGNFVAACEVSDSTSTQVTSALSIPVSPALSLTATVDSPVAAPLTVLTFVAHPVNGSGSYPTIRRTFGDGTVGLGVSVNHSFATPGHFPTMVSVTDSNGFEVAASAPVNISVVTVDAAPVVASVVEGGNVTFSVNVSGGAGAPYDVTWQFGDGTTGYGALVVHRYNSTGAYLPTVTALDRLGGSGARSLSGINVTAIPPPPPLLSTLDLALLLLGLLVAVLLVAFVVRRRRRDRIYPTVAGLVPATNPATTVVGSKVCRVCGAPNLPIRETCEACGASLPRASRR
ncbi:MAG: PKD domain-containing protein, partial [Thermoplasmata archaeon]|nr:PKD domain-containing protein [Thermoplasmata archaeon]